MIRRFVLLLLLLPAVALCSEYSVVFIDDSVPQDSLDIIYSNFLEIGGYELTSTNKPIWLNKADTNIVGFVASFRTDGKGVKDWKDLPIAQIETRVTKDVRPPDKQKVKVKSMSDFLAEYTKPALPTE